MVSSSSDRFSPHMARLLFRQDIGKRKQFFEHFLDVAAARVVAVDQLLKLFQVVGRVRFRRTMPLQLRAYGAFSAPGRYWWASFLSKFCSAPRN